ncbi:MAG TPA: AraC family transcriptional regulator [Gammaproteobacteria bacterium]
MPEFYRKTIVSFLCLSMLTALLGYYLCVELTSVSKTLFPAHESAIPWKLMTTTDVPFGGSSSTTVNDSTLSLNYDVYLTDDLEIPFVIQALAFAEPGDFNSLVDLTKFSRLTFKARCMPHNVLTFYVHLFDEEVTRRGDPSSYRTASTPFFCKETRSDVEIDFRHLEVERWWLNTFDISVSDHRNYRLDKVGAISYGMSPHSPVNVRAQIDIGELILHGHDWRYAWAFAGLAVPLWCGYLFWLFRQYTSSLIKDVKDKLNKDLPLIAYQQLSVEPHRDREKGQLLRFMAREYSNPDMSLEFAVTALGINRTKINELLRDELGMTFNAYLKKLRLAEATRLLSRDGANVADIARSVGYKNVPYFITLFKDEYGCTPKTFKDLRVQES